MAEGMLSCEEFFSVAPAPVDLEEVREKVKSFAMQHISSNRKLVLITSGGTTVPIEKKTVRYLDNFSTGSRGAISAEQFLLHGYAVIFLYRGTSLRPFYRSTLSLLDSLETNKEGEVIVKSEGIKSVMTKYKEVTTSNLLCFIPYSTLFEYLHYLRAITPLLNSSLVMIYLAAAVSDFYIHPHKMEEHKISSSNPLVLQFDVVPKLIPFITQNWSPKSLIVSFKLETDVSIILKSAKTALEKYGQQLVVANTLENRKTQLFVIERNCPSVFAIELSEDEMRKGVPIESKLISYLCDHHSNWSKIMN